MQTTMLEWAYQRGAVGADELQAVVDEGVAELGGGGKGGAGGGGGGGGEARGVGGARGPRVVGG